MDLSRLWTMVRRYVPVSAYPLLAPVYRANANRVIAQLEVADRRYAAEHGLADIPPARLRFRVVGACDAAEFQAGGASTRSDLEAALRQVGRSIDEFSAALDFGCGRGRTIRSFRDRPAAMALSGTDIDAEAIAWCQEHLPFARFCVNGDLPPLPFADESFDLVWSVSVFTHLPERHQFEWLEELRRVLRPGGYLLASVHGPNSWRGLPRQQVRQIERDGFVYARVPNLKGVFPDWYQTAWHTQAYIEHNWSKLLEVLHYAPRGLQAAQELVVVRKPARSR